MRLCVATAFALLLVAPAANANTIDFTSLNIDATNVWSLDGVTISGDAGAIFRSVLGHGLGLVGVGDDGAIDSVSSLTGSNAEDGSLSIHVDGQINAFTIQPYETIDGVPSSVGFEMGFKRREPNSPPNDVYVDVFNTLLPLVITQSPAGHLPDTLQRIGLFSDFGQIWHGLYMRDHPDAVFQFGFSITSLDYTPTFTDTQTVPEPASVLLLGLGGALLLLFRRHAKLAIARV